MHILLGVAGGEESTIALRRTIERTRAAGDDLTVAIIEKPTDDPTPSEIRDRVDTALSAADLDAEVRILEGEPASALVDFAEAGEFDQLVIGGGTVSPLGKINLGRITEFVLLNAPMTVTLVR